MSFCAKTCCEMYRDKKYCRAVQEKERNGVCDCRHACYPCQTSSFCFSTMKCGYAPEETKRKYLKIRELLLLDAKRGGDLL